MTLITNLISQNKREMTKVISEYFSTDIIILSQSSKTGTV